MNQEPTPPPPPPAARCVICATARESLDARCPECGLHPGLGPTERDPFTKRTWQLFGAAFVGLYGVVALLVWATN